MARHCFSALALCALVVAGMPSAAQAAAEIKIGVGAPMSGTDAVFGTQIRDGVELAVHNINRAGGILGRKLAVEIGDDAGDPKKGAAVAHKFVRDHVRFVIGHFNSGVTLQTAFIYAENAVLEITPASTNPQITEQGIDTLFRTCGRDDQQAAVAAKFLAGLGHKKIAILYDNTPYGKGLADLTREDLARRGITDVLYQSVAKNQKDYSAVIAAIKASGADIIFWGGNATTAGTLLQQMRQQGVKTRLMSGDAIGGDEFTAAAGDAAVGTYLTFPPDPLRRREAAPVIRELKAKGIDPGTYAIYAYAAVQIIKEAADKAKSLDTKTIAAVMHSGMAFKTVLGTISYDAKGDVTRPDYAVFVWTKAADGTLGFVRVKGK